MIRPIRTDEDHLAALREIETLMAVGADTAENDRLGVLATLVEAYEAQRFPTPLPDPIEAIKFMMDQKGLRLRDLELAIGPRSRVEEVLNRRRPLTLPMIRKLCTLLVSSDIRNCPLSDTNSDPPDVYDRASLSVGPAFCRRPDLRFSRSR